MPGPLIPKRPAPSWYSNLPDWAQTIYKYGVEDPEDPVDDITALAAPLNIPKGILKRYQEELIESVPKKVSDSAVAQRLKDLFHKYRISGYLGGEKGFQTSETMKGNKDFGTYYPMFQDPIERSQVSAEFANLKPFKKASEELAESYIIPGKEGFRMSQPTSMYLDVNRKPDEVYNTGIHELRHLAQDIKGAFPYYQQDPRARTAPYLLRPEEIGARSNRLPGTTKPLGGSGFSLHEKPKLESLADRWRRTLEGTMGGRYEGRTTANVLNEALKRAKSTRSIAFDPMAHEYFTVDWR